jgi:hypothetical protein
VPECVALKRAVLLVWEGRGKSIRTWRTGSAQVRDRSPGKRPGMRERAGTSGEASVQGTMWSGGELIGDTDRSAEPISSTLKMEAICSSETLVETQQTTQHHIPDDTLHTVTCTLWLASEATS